MNRFSAAARALSARLDQHSETFATACAFMAGAVVALWSVALAVIVARF